MKTIFTTGQVAKICKVAPRTVSKWFDSGRLKGYRIPGSQDRRIPRENLVEFCRENGMVLAELDEECKTSAVLIVTDREQYLHELTSALGNLTWEHHNNFQSAVLQIIVHLNKTGASRLCVVLDLTCLRLFQRGFASLFASLAWYGKSAEDRTPIFVVGAPEQEREALQQQGLIVRVAEDHETLVVDISKELISR